MKKIIGGSFLLLLGGILIYAVISLVSASKTKDVIIDSNTSIDLISVMSISNIIEDHIMKQNMLGFEIKSEISSFSDVGGEDISFKGASPECFSVSIDDDLLITKGYMVFDVSKFIFDGEWKFDMKVNDNFCDGDI